MGAEALIVVNNEKIVWSRFNGDKSDVAIEKVFKSEGQVASSNYFVSNFIKKDKPRLKLWYDRDLEEWAENSDVYYKIIRGILVSRRQIDGRDVAQIHDGNFGIAQDFMLKEFNSDIRYIYKVDTVDLTYAKYKI